LIADGLKYEYSSTTFESSLGYQDIEIVKGGDIETKRVYLVKGHSTHAHLQYPDSAAAFRRSSSFLAPSALHLLICL